MNSTPTTTATTRRVSTRAVIVVGLLLALLLAGVVSLWASASPDGLNRVAGDLGFAGAEQASGAQDGPLAGYEVAGVDSRWSGGLAGVVGCLVVLACTSALMLLRKRSTPRPDGGE
jgi:hypothetical protein